MLEEIRLPYEAHLLDFTAGDQKTPEFLSLNPNNKIPAILDPHGPNGKPLALFESGAILIYLADKTQQLLPVNPVARYQTIQWLMFQMGSIGPMFGQFGYFHKYAGNQIQDNRPRERLRAEVRRLLAVLNLHLQDRAWMIGDDYTIADIALFPWIKTLELFYQANEVVGLSDYPHVERVLKNFLARPAVVKGMTIPHPRIL